MLLTPLLRLMRSRTVEEEEVVVVEEEVMGAAEEVEAEEAAQTMRPQNVIM